MLGTTRVVTTAAAAATPLSKQPVLFCSSVPSPQLPHRRPPALKGRDTFLCSAHSRRLRQLAPDLPAEATDWVSPDPQPDASSEPDTGTVPAEVSNLEAYPCTSTSSSSSSSNEGFGSRAQPGDAAGAWTASDDADIDDAAHTLAGSWEQQQQGARGSRQAVLQSLPQPLLTPLAQLPEQEVLLQISSTFDSIPSENAAADGKLDSSTPSSSTPSSSSSRQPVTWQGALHSADDASSSATAAAAAAADDSDSLHVADSDESAAAAAAAAAPGAVGDGTGEGFFGSRVAMLQQLKQQQLQVQRQDVLAKSRQRLYKYTVGEDGSSITKQPTQGRISPLKQTSYALAKQQPLQQDQHAAAARSSSSSSVHAAPSPAPQQQQQQQAPASSSQAGAASSPVQDDPSRGLCLSAFTYCCSRNEVLSLTWQLGLSPAALRFVSRVADADLVLHVKPDKGERHYQYEEYRAQAAEKGIPFIDLKNLSLLELQLYLLPVFRLYAGELSPRDMLLRKKRRGSRRCYESIKLPPAKPRRSCVVYRDDAA